MGYKSLVANLTQVAIDLLGDLKVSGTYISVGSGTYDPTTDVMTSTDVTQTSIPMVVTGFDTHELEATKIALVDAKILIAAKDMSTITPKETDRIIAAGRTWQVVRFKSPPSDPLWILYVKEG